MDDPAEPGTSPTCAIIDWLLSEETRQLPSGPAVLKELCLRLNTIGLPVARASFHVQTLHPQLFGLGFYWYRGRDDLEIFRAQHGARDTELYRHSPIRLVFEREVDEIHQTLELPDDAFAFPRYAEIKAEGMTDYLILPLTFSDGKINATSWSTDMPGGFTDEQVTLIKTMLPVFSLLIEIHLNRRIAVNLLNAYVGHQAGERILSGQITRGSGETIPAAIWFSDLRGFTAMSETKDRDELLGLLNQYFDAVARPIAERGGEILKFIGDAVLAIFPLRDEAACQRAYDAAIEAKETLGTLYTAKADKGEDKIECGIALHVGEVIYGNIGSDDRLDFTVIGPAVNLASRIEGLCPILGVDILFSAAFKERIDPGIPISPLGRHRLKGVQHEVEVFSPSAYLVA